MKKILKKTGSTLLVMLAAVLLICGCSAVSAAGKITKDKAKQIALDRAKVKSADVKKWTKVKLDNWDKDRDQEWDVEFCTKTYKYEAEINVRTGKVEDFEKEKIKTGKTGTSTAKKLTKSAAKNAALKKAGVKNADVKKWTKVKLDGNEWEIKFQTASYKYEAEINARTGKVKDFEKKKLPAASSQKITAEKAKTIALDHAKKQANISGNVKYTKSKLDRDNGIERYEIEFRYGRLEFEYEINAKTGKILEWDMERDD